jgi:hypothetical protein
MTRRTVLLTTAVAFAITAGGSCVGEAEVPGEDVPIQDLKDGTVATGSSVAVKDVLVTGVRQEFDSVHVILQEPQGETSAAHSYPDFAGIAVFISAGDVDNFPLFDEVAANDCVSIAGQVNQGLVRQIQVDTIAAFARSTGCGDEPTPVTLALADVATDSDLASVGDQPGPLLATYDAVVVRVEDVRTTFTFTPDTRAVDAEGLNLIISFVFIDTPSVITTEQDFASITGVLSQGVSAALLPRTTADIVE